MATFFGSRSVVMGGNFTQVNNNVQARSSHTPWDRLQAAVAPAAFHNSAQRFDPPRCHSNTRVAVMDVLRDLALRRGDVGKARILWLSGPAGAGKSAIAQTFCEECFSINLLLASFFFNRSDPSRNTAKSFVGTLAYQIYRKVTAHHQSLILDAIENDPLVFERSVDAQFKALIIDPLRHLFESGYFGTGAPALIIMDGLDECSTAPAQINILTALQNISNLQQSPFVFIIASRPEHDTQMFFRRSSLGRLLHQLTLDDSYYPDVDIELVLREKMRETHATHPRANSIPQEWPSNPAIRTLVRKSSGQFIYASVVIKYVTSSRHYPPDRLDVVLQLRPPKRDLPFAELDALYSHIFSYVEDIGLILRVLCIILLFHERQIDILTKDVEELCELDQGECLTMLYDLQSVLRVESTTHGQHSIRLLHKSLPDYLQDPSRSKAYHINTTPEVVVPILTQCLRCISDLKLDYNIRCSSFISCHLDLLVSNIQMCYGDLMSFSLINCWVTNHGTEPARDESWLREKLLWFAFEFLNKLCTLEGTDYEHVYDHHLHQFPRLVDQFPQVYGPNSRENRDCIFPMIVIFALLRDSNAHISSKVFDFFHGRLSDVILVQSPMSGLENLSYSAAWRCINSLTPKSGAKIAAFALECLPLILPDSRLSLDLSQACLPEAPFAYTVMRSHQLSGLPGRAYAAMHNYRIRCAEAQPDWMSDAAINNFNAYTESKDVASLKAAIKNFDLAIEQYRKHRNSSLRTTLIYYTVAVWWHYADCGRSPEDLGKVIGLGTEARNSWVGQKNMKLYTTLLHTLAAAYFEQYKRAFGPSPIKPDEKQKAFDNAVEYYTELKDNSAAGSQRSAIQVELDIVFRTQSELEQTLGLCDIRIQHLQDALVEATEAGKEIDAGNGGNEAKRKNKAAVDNIKAVCLLALADCYEDQYTLGKAPREVHKLTMAIDSYTKAKPFLEDLRSPDLLLCLYNLARQHHLRWLETRDPSDSDTAKEMAEAAKDNADDDCVWKQDIQDLLVAVLRPESESRQE
ncbi:hypothetical protein D9619_008231 [Psilocybe cf. subviscida]|uniref:Nephrocystin 3-like N-terminal domain-containing protein n=1 Tax=Psilocybe cf. subviscida TaxID=2480587 RepID=A0A8H5AUB3_9AGAR|nr:hypothetical protein D9619_008231 [Psilocybe cf. subviscida]